MQQYVHVFNSIHVQIVDMCNVSTSVNLHVNLYYANNLQFTDENMIACACIHD